MPKCDVCNKVFKGKKEYDTFYNIGNITFCDLECVKKYVETTQYIRFDRHLEDRIRELQPGEMGGEPTTYSPRLRTSFRSGYEAVVAEKLILDWGWRVLYEPHMIKVTEHKTYIPDFYLPDFNCYLEVKGAWLNGSKKKFIQVQDLFGPERLLLIHAGYRHFFKSTHAEIEDLL